VQLPLDYETQAHRGFAFVEFEAAEDAAAAIDNMVTVLAISRFSCKPAALLYFPKSI